MRILLVVAAALLVAIGGIAAIGGCKKKKTEGTETGRSNVGTELQDAAAAAGAAGGCDLTGNYRLRFRTNGAEGWFLRFAITGAGTGGGTTAADAKGQLTGAQTMLGVDPAPLSAVTLDPAACKLTVRTSGVTAGDIGLALAVDAKTGAVTGQMTRTQAVSDDDKAVPVAGWRTAGEPTMPDACFVPGVYKVQIDPRATWRNPDDDRSCKGQTPPDVFVRIEAWGDDIVIDQVKGEPPYDQTWGEETITRTGCEIALGLVTEEIDLAARLTFVGGQVIGLVTSAKIQVVEETEESEDIWSCATESATISLIKL